MVQAPGELSRNNSMHTVTGESVLQKPFSRRKLFVGVVATGAAAMGFGYNKFNSGDDGPNPNIVAANPVDNEPTTESAHAVVEEELPVEQDESAVSKPLTRSEAVYRDREHQDPNIFREIADSSPLGLEVEFRLSNDTVSPEEYPEAIVNLLGAAINLGCTEQEVMPYLALDGDAAAQNAAEFAYLREMDEKYTYPVFNNLFKQMTREEMDENPTFKLFRNARHGVLRRFLKHARRTGNLNEIAAIDLVGSSKPSVKSDGKSYGSEMTIRVSNDVGDNDPTKNVYEYKGKIKANVRIDQTNGRLSTILVAHDGYEKIFKDLAKLN